MYIFPDFSAISSKKRKTVRIALGWVAGWRVYMNERYKCAQVNRCAAFHVSEREMSGSCNSLVMSQVPMNNSAIKKKKRKVSSRHVFGSGG